MTTPTVTPANPIRLLIADDHPIVREGLRGLLSLKPGFEVVGEAEDGDEAVLLALRLVPVPWAVCSKIHPPRNCSAPFGMSMRAN